jgi:hypothetical protein
MPTNTEERESYVARMEAVSTVHTTACMDHRRSDEPQHGLGATRPGRETAGARTTFVVRRTNEQLPVNYRAQFDKIIRSSSCDTLIQKIKSRLEQEPS